MQGDEYVEQILEVLDCFDLTCCEMDMVDEFLSGCLKHIYGKEFNHDHVVSKYAFENTNDRVMVLAPRRSGKTTALESFMIVLAFVVPDLTLRLISQSNIRHQSMCRIMFKYGIRSNSIDGTIIFSNGSRIEFVEEVDESSLNFVDDIDVVYKNMSGSLICVGTHEIELPSMYVKRIGMLCEQCKKDHCYPCSHKLGYFTPGYLTYMTPRAIRQLSNGITSGL